MKSKKIYSIILPGLHSRRWVALLLVVLPLPLLLMAGSGDFLRLGGGALVATPIIVLAAVGLFAAQVYYVAHAAETSIEMPLGQKSVSLQTALAHAPGVFVVSLAAELLAAGIYIIDAKTNSLGVLTQLAYRALWALLCFPINVELWFRYFRKFSKITGHNNILTRRAAIGRTASILLIAWAIFIATILFQQNGVGLIVGTLLSILSSILTWESLHYTLKNSVSGSK